MNIFFFLISIYSVLVSAADVTVAGNRNLEKSLLTNLVAHRNGRLVDHEPRIIDRDERPAFSEKITGLFSVDIQWNILSFLDPTDDMAVRSLNTYYFNLYTCYVYSFLRSTHPCLVLQENWANLALHKFFYKYFEKGRFGVDNLLAAVHEILFTIPYGSFRYESNVNVLNILAFLYDFEFDSCLPFTKYDLFLNIIKLLADNEHHLPECQDILEYHFNIYATINDLNFDGIMSNVNGIIDYLKMQPTVEELMRRLNFDPIRPIRFSNLKYYPIIIQVMLLERLLPICTIVEHFELAARIAASASVFSQFIFDAMKENFPELLIHAEDDKLVPLIQKQLTRLFPEQYGIVGLDYLVTRDAFNPFNLDELIALNPDYPELIDAFEANNTMTLLENDMIAQMKEAGLFEGIENVQFHERIDQMLSGKNRVNYIATPIMYSFIENES